MGKINDLTGKRFNMLVAIKQMHKDKYGNYFWLFKCDCGNEKIINRSSLYKNRVKSCGCLQKKHIRNIKELNKTHGMSYSPEYSSWKCMKQRCFNKNNRAYKNYGKKGVSICNRWLGFENFYEDMGKRPKGMTLERKDNNKGYCKENCIWETRKNQNRNTSRNIFVLYNGEKITLGELCETLKLNYNTIYSKYKKAKYINEISITVEKGKRDEVDINIV